MCGIGGFASARLDAPFDESTLRFTLETLRHRGPDDEGIWCEGRAGLCHTRLSIIDLSDAGHQPMLSASGRFVLSYNGELYNYRTLRSELQAAGVPFRGESDSEVLLAALETWGRKAIPRLRGMFAIALWDRERESLLLARDHAGIKPLFFVRDGRGIAFASEPKALPAPRGAPGPGAARIAEYLSFRFLADRESLLPWVENVPPGCLLETDGRDVRVTDWTGPGETVAGSTPEVLQAAVDRQLVSDVPVGIFLSGGVDSSLVAAAAADAGADLDSFTVGFREPGWDETDRSRRVADAVGSRMHVVSLEPENYASGLGEAIHQLDSPLNHAHSVHLLELSRQARRKIKVALTGEGGDELFGGYPRYRLYLASRRLARLPRAALTLLSRTVAGGHSRLARTIAAAMRDANGAAAINSAFVPIGDAARLAGLADPEEALRPRLSLLEEHRGLDPRDAFLRFEQRTYMVSLLQRMDRMSMAAGLECRVPLIDEAVVAHSRALAPDAKFDLRTTKKPLREASEQRYGRAYANLPKSGFGVPLDAWFRSGGPLEPSLARILSDPRTRERGWTDTELAERYRRQHAGGETDRTETLWGLLNLELWARISIDGDDAVGVLG
jgi:asparagine synthase (glutamine-hydrolysing)